MSDYYPRTEISAVERSGARVAPVPAATSRATTVPDQPRPSAVTVAKALAAPISAEDDAASAAEYASVHARIADILAAMRSEAQAPSVDGAAREIQSMLPAPIILVPLPPATREAVEQAAALAKKIADHASFAHAAQAHLRRGTVDQILSTAV